jgi:ubiquinone biosynthesis protein UbiJ
MSVFEDFYKSLKEVVDSFAKKDLMIKVESDLDSHLIKIFGENMSSLARAKSGLDDVAELAYTTAEHHPYWNLLYHASQISKITLEKWNANLAKEELDEIAWSIDELKNTCAKIREKLDTRDK